MRAKVNLIRIRQHLEPQHIDPALKELLCKSLYCLIAGKQVSRNDFDYCQHLTTAIIDSSPSDTRQLDDLLFIQGFNHPEYILYRTLKLQDELMKAEGLPEQLEWIITEQVRLNSLHGSTDARMVQGQKSFKEELLDFLWEKKYLVKQLIKLRRMVLHEEQLAKSLFRMKINLPVAQFGLFIRMQMEKGLLPKENVGQIFAFFAAHFYTPQTLFISAESLQKKSTDVEFSAAQKLKGHLISMINWLNENYNLSNFNTSSTTKKPH